MKSYKIYNLNNEKNLITLSMTFQQVYFVFQYFESQMAF